MGTKVVTQSDNRNRSSTVGIAAVSLPSFPEQDKSGVDLSLLRSVLALSPLERLRLMERRAQETRLLNSYGRRIHQARSRSDR